MRSVKVSLAAEEDLFLLMFNKRAGCSIGIDVGVDYVNGILTDLEGSILYEEQIKLPPSSPEVTIRKLIELIQQLITQMPSSPYGLIGIGLCIHGLVDAGEQIVFTPHSKWKNVDLKTTLQETFQVPIFIENEANLKLHMVKKSLVPLNIMTI